MRKFYCDICGKEIAEKDLVQYTGENKGDYHGECYERKMKAELEVDELPEVVHAYSIGIDGKVGFTFGRSVMEELRKAVFETLSNHRDDLIAYDWTLNDTYQNDGEQVVVHFRASLDPWRSWNFDNRLSELSDCLKFDVRECEYVETVDRKLVGKMCGMLARGELAVEGEME